MSDIDLIPQNVGRPAKTTGIPYTINKFQFGSNVYYDSLTIDQDTSRVINARSFKGTTLDRRKGKIVFGNDGDAGKVYMSAVMQVSNGTDLFLRLVEGSGAGVQLQKYDSGTDAWVDLGSNIGTADDRVDWSWVSIKIGGEDRLYFTNGVSDLLYTNGTNITEVPDIKCKYITNIGNVLVAANFTETFNSNDLLYAKGNTHQFYKDTDSSLASSTNRFIYTGEIAAIKGFNGYVYVFTLSDGTYEIDLSNLTDRQVSTHGTLGFKTISVGWDVMIWADQDGIWALPINGNILKISKSVDNIYYQVSATNVFNMLGHINTEGQYELHIGDISYEGESFNKHCLIYDIERSRFEGKNIWYEDSGREFANNAVNWTNSLGFTNTYYGSRTNQTTYQSDYGYEDGVGVDIETVLVTKDITLADEISEYLLENLYIEYQPDGAETIPLSLYARRDTENWRLIRNISLSSGSDEMRKVKIGNLPGLTGRALAFKIVSSDNKAFQLKKLYFTYAINKSDVTTI